MSNNTPQWVLDMGLEVEEQAPTTQKDSEYGALVDATMPKREREIKHKQSKKEGLTHKPFSVLKEVA